MGRARQITNSVPSDHEKLCAWWMDGREHILRQGRDRGKGHFLPTGAASPALHPQPSPAPPAQPCTALHPQLSPAPLARPCTALHPRPSPAPPCTACG